MNLCPSWFQLNTDGTVRTPCGEGSGPGNNGNLNGMTFAQGNLSFSQTYGYDNANRLTAASEAGGWSQSYGYDQPGNMWLTGTSQLPGNPQMPVNNLYDTKNQNPNFTYDAAGNQTALGGMTLTYDAENRQVGASNTLSGGSGVFQYDGVGQRVVKTVGGVSTYYVYDAFGQMAAEYSSQAAGVQLCNTCYLSYDHLGSVRMVTDEKGGVVARHDYAPYGVEVPAGVASRTNVWGVSTDVDVKYTGQLRDVETGEDYFNARYLASNLGRFMSADPGNAGADLGNPQSWHGYGYVGGNVLSAVDPSGMNETDPIGNGCFSAEYSQPCIGIPIGLGGGGSGSGGAVGGGGGGSVSAPPGSSTPLPPGSFPGGETLGLPPGVSVPLPGLGVLLGQENDCEFGVCGVLPAGSIRYSAALSGQVEGQVILLARDFLRGVKIWAFGRAPNERLISVGPFRVGSHQLTYGDWCGPGGSGDDLGSRDAACHVHDFCYDSGQLRVRDNFNPWLASDKVAPLQRCNQQLCDAAGGVVGWYFGGIGSRASTRCH